MKQIIKFLFIVIILSCTKVQAQNNRQITFESYIENGYYNHHTRLMNVSNENILYSLNDKLYNELGFCTKWSGFTAYTTLLTVLHPNSIVRYQPLQTQYDIGMKYAYKRLQFSLHHMCTHSTEYYLLGGGYTKLGVRIYFIKS